MVIVVKITRGSSKLKVFVALIQNINDYFVKFVNYQTICKHWIQLFWSQVCWVTSLRSVTSHPMYYSFWSMCSVTILFLKDASKDERKKEYLNCLISSWLLSDVKLLSMVGTLFLSQGIRKMNIYPNEGFKGLMIRFKTSQ